MNEDVKYMVNGKLFDLNQLSKKGWKENQINALPKFHNVNNKYFSEEQLKGNGWTDEQIKSIGASKTPETAIQTQPNQQQVQNDQKAQEPVKTDPESIVVNERPIEFHQDDEGNLLAKHPLANKWKPVNMWIKEDPEFWGKATEEYSKKHPNKVTEQKEQRKNNYEFQRQQLVNEIDAFDKEIKTVTDEGGMGQGYAVRSIMAIKKEKTEALAKFDKANGVQDYKTYSEKLVQDYSHRIKQGEEANVLNASKASLKANEVFISEQFLSQPQKKEWELNTKIDEIDKEIQSLSANEVPVEQKEAHAKKVQALKDKKEAAVKDLSTQLQKGQLERKKTITNLRIQLDKTENSDERQILRNEIKFQQSMDEAFIKSDGDPEKFKKEATSTVYQNYSNQIASIADYIPENATPEEALNIYFQTLLSERDHLTEKINTKTVVDDVFFSITDIPFTRPEVERLSGPDGVEKQIKALAPIVMLNKLPDELESKDGKVLTGNWAQKAMKNIGEGFGITGKEAAKIFMPSSGAKDAVITDKDLATQVTNVVDKLNMKDYVNTVPLEIAQDRASYERWTNGWIAERTGPTIAIMLPMAFGSAAYTRIARVVKPLKQLERISKTGALVEGAVIAEKATKLGKFAAKAQTSLIKGIATAVKTGLQYETGGVLFSGNESVANESDFLSGFLGGVGEGGVMVIPKVLANVFTGGKLNKFFEIATKYASKVSKPIGGGFGESGEEFIQSTYQLYRDTESSEEFKKQWLAQFGETTERFDFFAHTFMMGMAFRGAAQFGEMMAQESQNTYFKLSGEEKKQADILSKQLIAEHEKESRKEFQGYTSEYSDDNLSILHEDAKSWVEEAKKGKDKEEIKKAEQALKSYEAEMKIRGIVGEHAKIKADIENNLRYKEGIERTKNQLERNHPAEVKRINDLIMMTEAIDKKLTTLNENLNKQRVEIAKNAKTPLEFRNFELKNKLNNLPEEDLAAYEEAKIKHTLALQSGVAETILQTDKAIKGTAKQKILDKINKNIAGIATEAEIVNREEKRLADEKARVEAEVPVVNEEVKIKAEQGRLLAEIPDLEQKLKEFEDSPNSSDELIEKTRTELERKKVELKAIEDNLFKIEQEKENPTVPVKPKKEPEIKFKSLTPVAVKKTVEEAGYVSIMPSPYKSTANATGGGVVGTPDNEVIKNRKSTNVQVGDVLDVVKLENTQNAINETTGKIYKHFLNLQKDGVQVGGVKYGGKSKGEEQVLLKALAEGKEVKAVVMSVSGKSLTYELVVKPEAKPNAPVIPAKTPVTKTPVEKPIAPVQTDLEAKKADIEKRRKSSFDTFYLEIGENDVYEYYTPPNSKSFEEVHGKDEAEVKAKINAKYDVELAALESKPSQEAKPGSLKNFKSSTPKLTDEEIKKAAADALFENLNNIGKVKKDAPSEIEHYPLLESKSGLLKNMFSKASGKVKKVYKQNEVKGLLSTLTKSKDPVIAELTRLFSPYLSKLKNITLDGNSIGADFVNNTIRIGNQETQNQFNVALIHELGHAATLEKIEQLSKGIGTPEELEVFRQLNDLFEFSKDKALEEGKDFYGLNDVHEFISEIFSNKKFFDWANNTKYNDKTVVEKILAFLAKLFGIKPGSIAHNAFELAFKIMGTKSKGFKTSKKVRNQEMTQQAIKDKMVWIRDNEELVLKEMANYMHSLYYSFETPPNPSKLIGMLKEAIYASEFGKAYEYTHIIDYNRETLMGIAKLFTPALIAAKPFIQFEEAINETFHVDSAGRVKSMRAVWKPLFEVMRAEGIKNPEKVIIDLAHTPEAIRAFSSQKNLNQYLSNLRKSNPVLGGFLSDRSVISQDQLFSLINFAANEHVQKSIAIQKSKTKEHAIVNMGQQQELSGIIKDLKVHLKNFSYGKSQNADDALREIYGDYIKGTGSKSYAIKNDANLSREQQRVELETLYNELLTKITGLDWSGYLNNKQSEPNYSKDKNGLPNIIKFMDTGVSSFTSNPETVNAAINYFTYKPLKSQSNIVKWSNTALGNNNLGLRYRGVDQKVEGNVNLTSGFTLALEEAASFADHPEYKNNAVSQYLKNNPGDYQNMVGVINSDSKQVASQKTIAEYDLFSTLLSHYEMGEDTYLQFAGQFSDKTQIIGVRVPKHANAEELYIKRYNEWKTFEAQLEKDRLLPDNYVSFIKHSDKIVDDKMLADRIVATEGTMYEKVRKGDREAYIRNFLFNFALNKFDIDYIIHGRPSNYKNALDQVKRGGSTISPGISYNQWIEGGVGEVNEHHVVSNEFSINGEKEERLDGVQFALPSWMKKLAVSIGPVFSQIDKYGKYSTVKDIHSDVIDGDRKLDKINTVDLEPIAMAFPESIYGKMYEYMVNHKINTLSFTSGTKSKTDPVNELFKGGKFVGDKAPVKSKRRNNHTLMQGDKRHDVNPTVAKQAIQSTANFMPFPHAVDVARLWEQVQDKVLAEMDGFFENHREGEIDIKLLESIDEETQPEVYDYIKSGGNQINPYYDRLVQKKRSSILTKNVLDKNVNRTTHIEVPVADIQLEGMREVKNADGVVEHIKLAQVIINIEGLRYSSIPMSSATAIKEIENDPDYYLDMYNLDGTIKEWALEEMPDGKVYIPGEIVAYVNVPAENLRNHTYARAHKSIPGADNIIITDRETQVRAGRDFDSDVRFAETVFKKKAANGKQLIPVTSMNSKKGLTNHIQRIIQEEFENPANYDMIREPIDIDKYDYMIEKAKEASDTSLSSNHITDVLKTREINLASNDVVGIIQNFSTTYDFIKKHKLFFKSVEGQVKRFSLQRYKFDDPTQKDQTKAASEVAGFSIDRFNLVKNDIGNFMNLALDNAKDPKAGFMGINSYTAHMFCTFVATDTSIDRIKSREDQKKAIMDRIEAAVGYFNSPIMVEFIRLSNESKGTDSDLKNKEILLQLKEKFKESEYLAFEKLNYLSGEVEKVFDYINLTRQFPLTVVDYTKAKESEQKLRNNGLYTIDTSRLFKTSQVDAEGKTILNKTGDSPFISVVPKGLEFARKNNFAKSIESSPSTQAVVNRMLAIKSLGKEEKEKIFLTDDEVDSILKTVSGILVMKSFDQNKTVNRVANDLATIIAENKGNAFIDMLHTTTKNGVISVAIDENYANKNIAEGDMTVIKEDFDKLSDEIQDMFLYYSVGKYGIGISKAKGNYAIMFSNKLQLRIGERLAEDTKDWMNGQVTKQETDNVAEIIRMSNPYMDFPNKRTGAKRYVPDWNYTIDFNRRESATKYIVNISEGEGIRNLEATILDHFKESPRLISIFKKLFVEASYYAKERLTKEQNIRAYAQQVLAREFGKKAEQQTPKIEEKESVKIEKITNHSGGAIGADTAWDEIGKEFGMVNNNHYYFEGFKTPNGNTSIPIEQKNEADAKLKKANETLHRRFPTSKEYVNNLLRRNWWQVKNSDAIFAISSITDNKVDGGTGWAVHMAIGENKPVYVFDQKIKQWFTWNGSSFIPTEIPTLTKNFAGIGTREINDAGKQAIREVYQKTVTEQQSGEENNQPPEVKHQVESPDGISEMLTSNNPKLNAYIQNHFQKIFPTLEIFKSVEAFKDFIRKIAGDPRSFDVRAFGAALGNGVYINPNTALQSTFFHENAHIYWNLLPDNHPGKLALLEIFGNEEDAVQEIGRIGVSYAEEEMTSPYLTKIKNALRRFWIGIQKLFGVQVKGDPVLQMAMDIWKNKGDVFSKEEQLQTIRHQASGPLEFDEDTHIYTSGDIQFSSATTMISKLQAEQFDAERAATRAANKESLRLVSEGGIVLTPAEKEKFAKNKMAEWTADSERGTAGHEIIEFIRKGEEVPERNKQYFTPEAFDQFVQNINDYFDAIGAYPGTEIFEEMDADFDNFVAGTIDFQYEDTNGTHIRDFKFSQKKKWTDEGKLADDYVQAYNNRTMLAPLNNLLDSKKVHHQIQLNVYHLIKKERPVSLGIIPINYEVNDKGLISKAVFEEQIPVKINTESTKRLFEYNKIQTQQIIDAAQTIASENNYVDGISKTAEIESIAYLTRLIPSTMKLKDLRDNHEAADGLFRHLRVGAQGILEDELGFSEDELKEYSLFTLLTHWKNKRSRPDFAKEDYNLEPMPGIEYEAKLGDATSPFMLNKFLRDSDKAAEIYQKIQETATKKGVSALSILESMDSANIYNLEQQLRGMEDEAAGPLKDYVNRRLVRDLIVKRVAEENTPGNHGYRFATVLLAEMVKGNKQNSDISMLSKYFMTDRFISSEHKLFQLLQITAREQTDKAQHAKVNINNDVREIFKSGDIDMNNITEVVNGKRYYKTVNSTMTPAERKLIAYIEASFGRYDNYHSAMKSHPILSQRAAPRIPVFNQYEMKWSMNMFWKYGAKWPAYHKYFQPQPWDNYTVGTGKDQITFAEYKEQFNLGQDKLSDLKEVYNDLKERYKNHVKENKKVVLDPTHRKVKNLSTGIKKFESKKDKEIIIQGLNSMADKFFMESVIPLYKHTENAYVNTKHMSSLIRMYSLKQIFGGDAEPKSSLKSFVNTVLSMVAMRSLAVNEIAALVNLSVGMTQIFTHGIKLDAAGWRAIVPTAMFDGMYRYAKNWKKAQALLKEYNIVDVAEEHSLNKLNVAKEKASTYLLGYTVVVENLLHGISFVGMMDQAAWDAHDNKGKLDPAKKNLFNAQKLRVVSNVVRTTHGDYGTRNYIALNMTAYGKLITQFRNWMPAYIAARVGKGAYIDQNGIVQIPMYNAVIKQAVVGIYNILPESKRTKWSANVQFKSEKKGGKGLQTKDDQKLIGTWTSLIREANGERINFSKLPKYQQQAMGRAIRDIVINTVIVALVKGYLDDPDRDKEDKNSLFAIIPKLFLTRLAGDSFLVFNPDTYWYLLKFPSPAFKWVIDFGSAVFYDVMTGVAYFDERVLGNEEKPFSKKSKNYLYYQKNVPGIAKKGDSKAWIRTKKVAPAANTYIFKALSGNFDKEDKKKNPRLNR